LKIVFQQKTKVHQDKAELKSKKLTSFRKSSKFSPPFTTKPFSLYSKEEHNLGQPQFSIAQVRE